VVTEAPEKIWAYVGSFKMWRDHKTYQPPTQIEYTRGDIANAAIIDLINQNAALIKEVAALQAKIKETA
jgi:hypothetical protein